MADESKQASGIAWGDDISDERKAELEARLQAWERETDHGEHKGPFERQHPNLQLTGADVFWLAARTVAGTSEPQTVTAAVEQLCEANGYSFSELRLSALNLDGASLDAANLSHAYLRGANLSHAYLDDSNLTDAKLDEANLSHARLLEANLSGTGLHEANLSGANLSGADLSGADLWHANLSGTDLYYANLSGASLVSARLNVETSLADVTLSSTTRLADVIWNAVPLARVAWEALPVVGDETKARKRLDANEREKGEGSRITEHEAAVRSYRLLAVNLRDQGLNEHADHYSYRAQLMQRVVLRRQAFLREEGKRIRLGERLRKLAAYLGSGLLDIIAGYGYRPGRSILAYLVIICGFAGLYLLNGQFASPHLRWDEALVLSISSFHGRGFFTSNVSLGDTLARLAAGEAIVGLLLEITFIATFTNRFFAR